MWNQLLQLSGQWCNYIHKTLFNRFTFNLKHDCRYMKNIHLIHFTFILNDNRAKIVVCSEDNSLKRLTVR